MTGLQQEPTPRRTDLPGSSDLCLVVGDTLNDQFPFLPFPLMHSFCHFSCLVSSALCTFLSTGYRVNTQDKRAFSKAWPGDGPTPVTRFRNYSYFNSDKPKGMLLHMCYYGQRFLYEMICHEASLYAVKLGTHWPPAFLPHVMPSPLLPLPPQRSVSCLYDGILFVQ